MRIEPRAPAPYFADELQQKLPFQNQQYKNYNDSKTSVQSLKKGPKIALKFRHISIFIFDINLILFVLIKLINTRKSCKLSKFEEKVSKY